MNYPGLSTSLKTQVTANEWNLIHSYIEKVDTLAWHQNNQACELLETAARTAVDKNYYRCAAKILYYYDHFFAA